MARTRMVTRTVIGTEAEVQIVCISASEISTIKVLIGGEQDDEKLLKAIKKQTETDDIKVLKVLDTQRIEKCYGMTEAKFIELAQELDPTSRKALEAEEASEGAQEETEAEATDETEEAPKTNKRGGKK